MFESFLAELHAADPEWDWAPLVNVLENIEYNSDDVAIALRHRVRWAVAQTQFPALARLKFIEKLMDQAVPPKSQLLH